MRINYWWRVTEWVPVARAAFAMVKELRAMPDSPLLQSRTVLSTDDWRLPFLVQHWRSFDGRSAQPPASRRRFATTVW